MRSPVERDPIEKAEDELREAARRYAGEYLCAAWSSETDVAAQKLRIAATNYALAVSPPKKARRA